MVKESKKAYYINDKGKVMRGLAHTFGGYREFFGNRFDTREKAELVVCKLKAWQQLKNKGFKFNRWTIPEEPKTPHIKLVIEAEMDVPDSPYDLDLLFSGEDD